jgi:hypothetical protein
MSNVVLLFYASPLIGYPLCRLDDLIEIPLVSVVPLQLGCRRVGCSVAGSPVVACCCGGGGRRRQRRRWAVPRILVLQ